MHCDFWHFFFLTNIFQYGWVYGPSLSNDVARLIDEHLERLEKEQTIRNLKATWENETQKCFTKNEDVEESGTTFRDFAGLFVALWVCGGIFILWRYLQDNVQSLQRCFPRQFQPEDANDELSFSRTNSLSQAPAATVGQLSNLPASGPSESTPQMGKVSFEFAKNGRMLRALSREISLYTMISYYTYMTWYTCMQACMHAWTHTYIHAYIHTYIHKHTYIHIHTYTYIHTHAYIHTYTYIIHTYSTTTLIRRQRQLIELRGARWKYLKACL